MEKRTWYSFVLRLFGCECFSFQRKYEEDDNEEVEGSYYEIFDGDVEDVFRDDITDIL